jgi:hypothetical protein
MVTTQLKCDSAAKQEKKLTIFLIKKTGCIKSGN